MVELEGLGFQPQLTLSNTYITIDYMKIFMDADCLIKITKAGLKEFIADHYDIIIPSIVEFEVVNAGLVKGHSDAGIVRENIIQGLIKIHRTPTSPNGDDALVNSFASSKCQAVATDDRKLARTLKSNNIPYMLPALLIYQLCKNKKMNATEAKKKLNKLKPYISLDELNAVKILLEAL